MHMNPTLYKYVKLYSIYKAGPLLAFYARGVVDLTKQFKVVRKETVE